MSTNRKLVLLALMAIVLSLALPSCDSGSPGQTNAEVRVIGSSAKTATTLSVSSRSNQQGFSSGEIFIGDENITDRLTATPATGQNGTNDLEFTTTVEVPAVEKIEYRVEPKSGFVFDEWEFDRRNMLRRDYPNDWRSIMMEILDAIRGDNETISINPEYIKYIRPTFDRGAYFDKSYNENDSDGSSTKPFSNMQALFDFISKESRFDDNELTIKIRGDVDELDLSKLTETSSSSGRRYWDDGDLEIELTIAGGYGDNWNVSKNNKSTIKNITMPEFKRGADTEIEIEFRNIKFESLDYSNFKFSDDDFEIDFRNCEVEILKNARGVINGLIVEEVYSTSSSNKLAFVNSVAPYNAGYKYYHSVINDWSSGNIEGKNNIVVHGTNPPSTGNSDNHYVATFDGYKTDNPDLIEELMQATPLVENQIKFGDDDDILEEDIEGRDRFLFDDDYFERDDDDDWDDDRFDDDDWDDDIFNDDRYWGNPQDIRVSYGPYEYRWDY